MLKKIFLLAAFLILAYGSGRLYYHFTGGFQEANIAYDLPYDERWEMSLPSNKEEFEKALNQPFFYLGKGCQSYVFSSLDGRYVIKFFKYQRFRPQGWLSYLTFLPGMENFHDAKVLKKKRKLDAVFTSWKLSYEHLPEETGVVFVHLNKSTGTLPEIVLFDKLGLAHKISLDRHEFLLQKKATLLCPSLTTLMKEGKEEKAKDLLDQLVAMIIAEYERGFADNDHALMQNTGVFEGKPVHIDVGQFVHHPKAKNPEVFHQELFNKMYKFRLWLKSKHPSLEGHLNSRLKQIMPETFDTMSPTLRKGSVGRLSHFD